MTVTEVLTTRQQRKSMARTLANDAYPIKAWRYVLLRAAAALAGATLVFFGIGIAKADPWCGDQGQYDAGRDVCVGHQGQTYAPDRRAAPFCQGTRADCPYGG